MVSGSKSLLSLASGRHVMPASLVFGGILAAFSAFRIKNALCFQSLYFSCYINFMENTIFWHGIFPALLPPAVLLLTKAVQDLQFIGLMPCITQFWGCRLGSTLAEGQMAMMVKTSSSMLRAGPRGRHEENKKIRCQSYKSSGSRDKITH